MCRYNGFLKNNETIGIEYTVEKQTLSIYYNVEKIYIDKQNYSGKITFHFTVYIKDKYAVFDINTENYENSGLGTFLLHSMLSILKDYNVGFVAGKLSTADYNNGNWKRSIPFYLKELPNSYIVEAYEQKSIKFFNELVLDKSEILQYYYDMESFIKETQGKRDGYIICQIVASDFG